MHEDLLFPEKNWGHKVISHFEKNKKIGLIGLGGSRYKSKIPSGWSTGIQEYDLVNIQHKGNLNNLGYRFYSKPKGNTEQLVEACVLDGVWICTKAEIWEKIKFNNKIKGFHFYDIDFSLRASAICKIGVAYDIEAIHFSEGNFNNTWMAACLEYHKILAPKNLPISSQSSTENSDFLCMSFLLDFLKKSDISRKLRLEWVKQSEAWKKPNLLWPCIKFILYNSPVLSIPRSGIEYAYEKIYSFLKI